MSQFYVWDENNVNIQSSLDFLNDNQRKNGFTSGTAASSSRTNTALRQSTLITAALMEMLTSYKNNSALTVQSSINDVKQAILDGFKNFEATNMTVTFASGSNREALLSGETLSASMGKISSWLIALKALAFKATVSNSDIADGAITSDKLANGAVTTGKIASSVVGTANIQANAVNAAKLADSAVTTTKIVNDAITSDKLANSSVTTGKITNSAITTAKFASDATCPRATYAGNNISAGTIDARLNSLSSRLDTLGFKQGNLAYNNINIGKIARLGKVVYGYLCASDTTITESSTIIYQEIYSVNGVLSDNSVLPEDIVGKTFSIYTFTASADLIISSYTDTVGSKRLVYHSIRLNRGEINLRLDTIKYTFWVATDPFDILLK